MLKVIGIRFRGCQRVRTFPDWFGPVTTATRPSTSPHSKSLGMTASLLLTSASGCLCTQNIFRHSNCENYENKEKPTAPVIRIAAPSVSRGRRMRCDVAALARDIVASISEIQKDASRSNRELVSTLLRKSRKMEASRS